MTAARTMILAKVSIVAAALLASVNGPASATIVTDPANDSLASFTGAKSPDIDVLSASATFDGSVFHLGGTLNGAIGTLPTSLYVFGVNRGAGTSNFANLGLPGVVFDTVVTLTGAGVLGGRDLAANAPLTLTGITVSIAGASFLITVPAADLPSRGFSPLQYQFNLWPRDTAAVATASGPAQPIADFAPDATNFVVSAVPEPRSLAMLGTGALGLAVVRLRRSTRPA